MVTIKKLSKKKIVTEFIFYTIEYDLLEHIEELDAFEFELLFNTLYNEKDIKSIIPITFQMLCELKNTNLSHKNIELYRERNANKLKDSMHEVFDEQEFLYELFGIKRRKKTRYKNNNWYVLRTLRCDKLFEDSSIPMKITNDFYKNMTFDQTYQFGIRKQDYIYEDYIFSNSVPVEKYPTILNSGYEAIFVNNYFKIEFTKEFPNACVSFREVPTNLDNVMYEFIIPSFSIEDIYDFDFSEINENYFEYNEYIKHKNSNIERIFKVKAYEKIKDDICKVHPILHIKGNLNAIVNDDFINFYKKTNQFGLFFELYTGIC